MSSVEGTGLIIPQRTGAPRLVPGRSLLTPAPVATVQAVKGDRPKDISQHTARGAPWCAQAREDTVHLGPSHGRAVGVSEATRDVSPLRAVACAGPRSLYSAP